MWWLLAVATGLAQEPPTPAPVVEIVHPLPEETRVAMRGVTWREGCPVGLDELSLLRIRHHTPAGGEATGTLIVHREVSALVGRAFTEAHAEGFAITRMEPAHVFGGSDDASMAADNTSAFNCRAVTGGRSFSRHSFGRAIDVNPLRNPYVSGSLVLPPAGSDWLDRAARRPGMLHEDSVLVRVLGEAGWGWGGRWSSKKDYQHLSESGR